MGRYRSRVWFAGFLSAGLCACSGDAGAPTGDAGDDAASDTGSPDTADVGSDVPPDSDGVDAPAPDAAPDASPDVVADAEPEVWTGELANLRVVNLVQSAPGIDVWIDGNAEVADGAFQQIRYLETGPPLGNADVYYPTPARPTDALLVESGSGSEAAFYTQTWNLSPEAYYTVFVHGVWDTEELRFAPTVGVVVDDPSAPAEQTTRMRFVAAAPALDDVTVRVGETVLAENLAYGTYTPDYVSAEVGTYELIVFEGDVELFRPRITVGQETMNVFIVGETLDDLAMVTVNQGNALTMYEP